MPAYCNICGKPILTQYYVYRRGNPPPDKGLIVCDRCRDTMPRCVVCRVPMNPALSVDGLCALCAAQVPLCSACGRRIPGRYFENPATGARFCESCFNNGPHCDVCGGAVGHRGAELHDGRFICAVCHQTAVYDPARAHELYRQMIQILERQLDLRLAVQPALQLVDRAQMLALLQKTGLDQAENSEMVFGLFVRRSQETAIYVESGLPQILMLQVLAHEYAHAWQTENCRNLSDPLPYEGFAEWVAYQALMALGAVKKAALMEQRADFYGMGLRSMLYTERRQGAPAVFQACAGDA